MMPSVWHPAGGFRGLLESRSQFELQMQFDLYHQKLATPRGTLVQTLSATALNENYPTYESRRFLQVDAQAGPGVSS
jgi:hypothetical protein